ncbi:DNA-binding XRE family transcriptional regulator [Clostridium acetobutylicum]|uniref:Transcriptional regulator (Phage-related) (Xre family) n=4 Tax=Clostridium acetobutylicum TaxID=1488 RepID=Q97HY9_CLOAB|nr:helix-turn-helix transcriptional regulator [Clostridium acetobutylicum]PSM07981.1 XRE family transcriptional regulator [Clostridium sp. NJ4]AAK79831.1 Transcriptional regulator (phage-related) (Xre family) [Clostridium acetobutylicum ATCC 824]ADZ20917.1 Transcriptional regulator (phage-related) (Xre family) [Clostridium acetobutylicum EA 2018]AEI32010.1 Xre family transcriptional regulator [Clostridium acetobutylicum DSM 1731]AWV82214.1 XRE family transcriptional regulator [Clostridium acet
MQCEQNYDFSKIFTTTTSNTTNLYKNLPEKTIGEKIYKLRMLHGYSRREFAKVCSIGYTSVCKYELNYSLPHPKNLNKICSAFNISMSYFL